METVGVLFLIALLILAWTKNTRARELATDVCRKACRAYDVQMLDGTVGLSSMGISRLYGGLRWRRRYLFNFSRDGFSRETGTITMIGNDVETIYFAPEDKQTTLRP